MRHDPPGGARGGGGGGRSVCSPSLRHTYLHPLRACWVGVLPLAVYAAGWVCSCTGQEEGGGGAAGRGGMHAGCLRLPASFVVTDRTSALAAQPAAPARTLARPTAAIAAPRPAGPPRRSRGRCRLPPGRPGPGAAGRGGAQQGRYTPATPPPLPACRPRGLGAQRLGRQAGGCWCWEVLSKVGIHPCPAPSLGSRGGGGG